MDERQLKERLQATAEELRSSYGYTTQQLLRAISDSTFVPATVFAGEESPLRSLVTYLHRNEGMEYSEIAEQVHRSYRAVWGADRKTRLDVAETEHHIPLSAFDERKSVLETVVTYLRTQEHLKFTDIARILKKDPRTVWTAWSRAQKK